MINLSTRSKLTMFKTFYYTLIKTEITLLNYTYFNLIIFKFYDIK